MKLAKKIVRVVALLGLLAVVGFAIWAWPLIYGIANNPFNDERFDKTKWLKACGSGELENPRGPMAEDARRRFLRKGMSKTDVRALLGPPDNSEWVEGESNQDCYNLGCWGLFAIDPSYLVIQYDTSGKIVSTCIVET